MSKTTFSLSIADVVFGEKVSAQRLAREAVDIERFSAWLKKASASDMHARCADVDQEWLSKLSGPSMLKVARLIEEKFPEVIQNMPVLSNHQEQLHRARTMEQVFMPSSLSLLARALEAEGSP